MYFFDSHVHLHHPEHLSLALDHCVHNMRTAHPVEVDSGLSGLLLVAELPGQQIRTPLLQWAQEGRLLPGELHWSLGQSAESGSIQCLNQNGDQILICFGYQVNSLEKLEVLFFGEQEVEPGQPLSWYLDLLSTEDPPLIILPWGVGKWLGTRGKIMSAQLASQKHATLCLGDNGNRPGWWRSVAQFDLATANNIPVLRGTDPLFLDGQPRRVGSFGHIVHFQLDIEKPLQSLKKHLKEWPQGFTPYGTLQKTRDFVRSQIQLRLQ